VGVRNAWRECGGFGGKAGVCNEEVHSVYKLAAEIVRGRGDGDDEGCER
jgi:hypothetical protein